MEKITMRTEDVTPAVPHRKRARRGDRVRKLILDTALDCFSTYGFEGTSTRLIADLSGVTHSLILYHFESKDKLWTAAMEEVVGSYAQHNKEIVEQSKSRPAAEILEKYIEEYVGLAAKMPHIHRIMTQQSTQASERFDWLIENHLRENFAIVCDLIRRGQQDGTVRPGDPARLFYFIVSAASTPFTASRGYQLLADRDIFSAVEIRHLIMLLSDIMFVRGKPEMEGPARRKVRKPASPKSRRLKINGQ
jgi:TetR/AcrR family transcriptional regulator